MSPAIALRIVGPDRFCPVCKRWLVRVHEDGRFDLAAEAGLDATTDLADVYDEHGLLLDHPNAEAVAVEAICLRCEARLPVLERTT